MCSMHLFIKHCETYQLCLLVVELHWFVLVFGCAVLTMSRFGRCLEKTYILIFNWHQSKHA